MTVKARSKQGNRDVTIRVADSGDIDYDPEEVTTGHDKKIVMTLQSLGQKRWRFRSTPITINDPFNNFDWRVNGAGTILTIDNSEDDRHELPHHVYRVHVESDAGDRVDLDPIIKDRV